MNGSNERELARLDAKCVGAALRVGALALLVAIAGAFGGMGSAQAAWITISNSQSWGEFGDGGFGDGDTLQILSGGSLTLTDRDGLVGNMTLMVEDGGSFVAQQRLDMDNGAIITMNGGTADLQDEFKFPDNDEDNGVAIYLYGGTLTAADTQSYSDRGSILYVGGGEMITGNTNDSERDPSDSGSWNIQLLPGYDTLHIDDLGGNWKKVWASGPPQGNDSVITTSASQDFGRVILGQAPTSGNLALAKTGDDATTYTATPSNDGLSATADGSIDGGAQTENITASLVNNANGSGSTGPKSWTVTIDNTAADFAAAGQGSDDADDVINVSGTIVDERVVSQTGGPVDFGKSLVGVGVSGTAVLATTGADDHFTRITVAGGSDAAITVAVSGDVFDSTETQNRAATGAFSTSGSKSAAVNLVVTGEGLAGEGAYSDVAVSYIAEVYQPVSLSTSINVNDLMLANAAVSDGGQRAAAATVSDDLTGDSRWSVSGFTAGTVITANSNDKVAEAAFDATGLLAHPTRTYDATYTVTSEYDDGDIAGTAGVTFDSVWNLSAINATSTGGSADVGGGEAYAGYGATSVGGTNVVLLGGTASDGGTISMSFSPDDDFYIISDMVTFDGTSTDTYVLQMGYDEAALMARLTPGQSEEEAANLGFIVLAYRRILENGERIENAVDHNDYSGGGAPFFAGVIAYDPGSHFFLGYYGVDIDNDVVWAVLNHNSEFGVGVLPEPAGLGMIGLALLAVRKRRS